MLRCTNPECRASLEFNIQALGDRYKRDGDDMTKVKAGKRTKPLDEVGSYQAKCMTCGHKDLVKNLKMAYSDPMRFFDASKLCNCGGEITPVIEYVKPPEEEVQSSEYDGYQRKVIGHLKQEVSCEKCGKVYNE